MLLDDAARLGHSKQVQFTNDNPPGTGLGELIDLLLEIDYNFLVLLAQDVSGLLALEMDIFEELAELGQLRVPLSVDLKLKFPKVDH